MLGQCLQKNYSTTFSKNSFNNKFGLPISLINLNKDTTYGIFEIGMDKKGEIDYLSKIIKPDVGVITNISYAHAKNFKSLLKLIDPKALIIPFSLTSKLVFRGIFLISSFELPIKT